MDLLLIRHGQSGNNLLWQQTGSSLGRSPDPSLTDLGVRQANAVADAIAAEGYGPRPTHVYTSLMLRAVQTAAPIVEALDLPLFGHRELFEVFGPVVYDADPADPDDVRPHPGAGRAELTAVSSRLVWPEHPVAPTSAGRAGWWSGPVERMADVPDRAARVVAALVAEHGDDAATVALVCHGTFGQFLFRRLLGIESMTGWVELQNTSVTRFVQVTPDNLPTIAVAVSRVDHLIRLGSAAVSG